MAGQTEKLPVITGHRPLFAALKIMKKNINHITNNMMKISIMVSLTDCGAKVCWPNIII